MPPEGLFISSTFKGGVEGGGGGGVINLPKWGTILLYQTTIKWYQFSIKNFDRRKVEIIKHMSLEVL